MFPKFFAGLGVEARRDFLQIGALSEKAIDVKLAVRDDRRGLPGKRRRPERLFRIDLVRQAFFLRRAEPLRAAPVQPPSNRRSTGSIGTNHGGKKRADRAGES